MPGLSVDIAASPEKVLAAFKRIQEAARSVSRDLKSMADIHNLPGVDDAVESIERLQGGVDQMRRTAVTSTAATLRTGIKKGIYSGDIVSILSNIDKQYPDPRAAERFARSVVEQSARISQQNVQPSAAGAYQGPGANAVIGGLVGGNFGGIAGGVAGGAIGGLLGPVGSMIGATIGAKLGGKLQAGIGEMANKTITEDFGMTDLRRSTNSLNEGFRDFRDTIRKAGDGLGVFYNETLQYAQTYARMSGANGVADVASGTHNSILLGRGFGLDPAQAANMMGRAGFVGVGGGDQKKQATLISEAMEGSHLGARQFEAADAMLKFSERSASVMGANGNVEGFVAKMLAIYGSKDQGIRANAPGIVAGFDEAVRGGGRTEAAHIMMLNIMKEHGITNPFEAEAKIGRGATFAFNDGTTLGTEVMKKVQGRYGADPWAMGNAMQTSFGIPANVAKEVVDLYLKAGNAPDANVAKKVAERLAELERGLKGGNEADALRMAQANKENQIQKLLGDRMPTIMAKLDTTIGDLVKAINDHFPVKGERAEAVDAKSIGQSLRGLGGTPRVIPGLSTGIVAGSRSLMHGAPTFSATEAKWALPSGLLDWTWNRESHRSDPRYMKSKAGARGPFGFMPDTAVQYKLKDVDDVGQSSEASGHYFSDLLKRHHNNIAMALASYNWSEKKLGKYGFAGMPKETRGYLTSYQQSVEKAVAGGSKDPKLLQALVDLAEALRAGVPVALTIDHQHGTVKKSAKSPAKIPVPMTAGAH